MLEAIKKAAIITLFQKAEKLPTVSGSYEITIDYSALYAFLDYVEPAVEAYSFGSFVIEDDFLQ